MENFIFIAVECPTIQNINEYMEKTEDNRLKEMCDFIKQESLKENN